MSSLQCQNATIEGKAGLHPVVRDVLISGATTVFVSIASLLVVSFIGRLADPTAVAEYLLVRRVSAWIISGALLGITVALPRYVAHAVNRPAAQKTYFSVSLALALGVVGSIAVLICAASATFSRLLFGNSQFRPLIVPLAMLLLANALNAVVFGFYRGRLQMERANGLQFVNFAVVPLLSVVVLATRGSIALMYSLMSVLMLVWTAAMAIPILRETHEQRSSWHVVSGELLRYGTARIPGELALNGLFTLAPVIASHFVSVANLAPLLLGLGILSVLGTSANPLNQVLLSKITMMLAEERMQQARRYIQHLLAGSIEVATFATVQAVLFADVAVRVWVGPKYVNQMVLIRILLAALPFYLLHTALRCVIDAASVTAYNTRNILWTFFTFVAVIAIAIGVLPSARLLDGIAGAFLVSLIVLAWLTVRTLKHLYDVGFAWRGSLPSLAFSFLVGIVGFGARAAQHFQTSALQFAGFQLLFGGLFLLFLNRHGSPWMGFLREAFLQRKTVASNAAESLVLKSA